MLMFIISRYNYISITSVMTEDMYLNKLFIVIMLFIVKLTLYYNVNSISIICHILKRETIYYL